MYYVLGLKTNQMGGESSPYQVGQQIFISTQKGFDDNSSEQMNLGFAVQGENSNAVCLFEGKTLEEAKEFIESEYDVFKMDLPSSSLGDFVKNIVERYGVRKLSKGEFATFDFSPPTFGGNPYKPTHLEKGCEVLIISDKKGHMISEYMKAAIGGLGGNVDEPSLEDLEKGKNALKELGFNFESHDSKDWDIVILVGKEPNLV
jgi:hypothetical protein